MNEPQRYHLPDTRHSVVHKFSITGQEGYIIAGVFEDGTLGEVFIKMAKEGSTLRGLIDTIGILISMLLQVGVPVSQLHEKFEGMRFEPRGFTHNKDILEVESITDYIFRWLDMQFPTP